jgi:fructose-bisphosphate aldolase class I
MTAPSMADQMRNGAGFIAALDQSGGSTPKALRLYGIGDDAWTTEDEMFDLIHAMRARIVNAPAFTGDKVIGAILFEQTMDRAINGMPSAQYLWEKRSVVPFLKIDKGLEDETLGVQLMRPIPGLEGLLARAAANGIFGTKERSVIHAANAAGIKQIVDQQFELADSVVDAGLMPIIEPEVNINAPDKAAAEDILLAEILSALDGLPEGRDVMLKLTLPNVANLYAPLVAHPRVMRVVALSGGYARDEANAKLAANHGVIASFSRALTEALSAQQSDEEFNAAIAETIDGIHAASIT